MISVVIPTFKNPDSLNLALQSCIEGQKKRNQIIVVIDGEYSINEEVLKRWSDYVEILNLEENVGLCRATNLGVYNSKHDKVLIVNDDNVFPLGWDVELEKYYSKDTVIAPNQIEPHPSMFKQFIIQNLGTDPKTFDLKKYWNFCKTLQYRDIDDCGSTLPIFVNKEKFLALGGWDENYEKGLVADWDFFLKCKLMNLKTKRLYTCPFYHFVSLSVNNDVNKSRAISENRAHEYAKYKWGVYIKHNVDTNDKSL